MFAQLLDDLLRAAVMEVQRRERCAALEYEDQVRPAERRPRPAKRLQVFYVEIHDVLCRLR